MDAVRIRLFSLLLGVATLSVQIVYLREFMTIFYGNELCVGLVLAAWMIWIAVGSWAAYYLKPQLSLSFLMFLFVLVFLFSISEFFLIRFVRTLLDVPTGEFLSFLDISIFSFLLLAVPCFIFGYIYAWLGLYISGQTLINVDPSAYVYAWESIGSVIASTLISLVLVRFMDQTLILLFLILVCSLCLWILSQKGWVLIIALLCMAISVFKLDSYVEKQHWKSVSEQVKLLEKQHSRYGRLDVLEWGGERILYSNGIKQTPLPDPIQAQTLAALTITQHPSPENVLLIGGGLGGLAPEIADYPADSVQYIEMNKNAYHLALKYLPPRERDRWQKPNLEIIHADGRFYLLKTQKSYDMIIINVGNPMTASVNRYYTREFFLLAQKRLSLDGILVICNFPSSADYLGAELLQLNASLYFTLKSVFSDIMIVPGESAIFFAAQDAGTLVTKTKTLSHRYQSWNMTDDYFFPQLFSQYFYKERMDFISMTLSKSSVQLNYDFEPLSYYLDFIYWNKLVHGSSEFFSSLLGNFDSYTNVLILIAGVWLIFTMWGSGHSGILAMGVVVQSFIIGFLGMTFNILFILAFQTIFGYLYEFIGLAVAAFMAGMAFASLVTNYFLHRKMILILSLILLTIFAGILLEIFHFIMSEPSMVYFISLIIICGALLGSSFPLLCDLYYRLSGKRQPGTIYAADLAGASSAAFLVSGFFIPLAGFKMTLNIVTGGGLVCLLFLLILGVRRRLGNIK